MMERRGPEALGIARCSLGEGPLWTPDNDTLHFVDIDGQALHSYDWNDASHRERNFDVPVCCIADAGSGDLLIALDTQLSVLSEDRLTTVWSGGLPADVRFNDGKCDPTGRFFVGTTHRSFEDGHGCLYRLDGQDLTVVLDGLGLANGLAWTSDGQHMLHIDTLKRQVAVYDYDLAAGELVGLSHVLDLSHLPGMPDGMTIDAEDRIWVAFWDGGSVVRLDLSGAVLQIVELPVPHVTSCCFAGPNLETLVMTTANPTNGNQPDAGDVFKLESEIRGTPTVTWRAF